ncbi:MAG: hypothetical protein WC449_05380 [Candidatus Paceibacterota bacterium]
MHGEYPKGALLSSNPYQDVYRCVACDGTGYDEDTDKICPHCHGEGVIREEE